jgi:4-hydroxy-tetrahydrodipicolinate synthase
MLPVVQALFIETNPIPVKEALTMMGLPSGKLRLPLVALRPENHKILRNTLLQFGLIRG